MGGGGDGGRGGGYDGQQKLNICPMRHAISWRLRVHNHHLMISCPWSSISSFAFPTVTSVMWLEPFRYHLPVWSLQNIVHTWSWDQASEWQIYHYNSSGPICNSFHKNGVCADILELETHGTGVFAGLLKHTEFRPRYQNLGFAHVDPNLLW